MKMVLIRTLTGYTPADADSLAKAAKHKPGVLIEADVVQPRNYRFHKKYFALLKLGFEYWEPPAQTYRGRAVTKDFTRFRHDVAILSGYYEPVWNLKGELRLEPKSIAFANMSEEDFEGLYSASIQVLLDKVLEAKGFTEAQVRVAVDEILRFD
jgi:hypothetical protein